ncbi:MAG TPA: alpha/beta fold hydrolase [Myxococcaceae bacterium]|nr:alpha/beta fold hydrolase [Myxococcaceae bacterium]
MGTRSILVGMVAGLALSGVLGAEASVTGGNPTAHAIRIPVGKASLYAREIGRGTPLVILHGGPDFDHRYLLPEMDRLADGYRLIFYDQRGRGASARDVLPRDVTLSSEVEDLDRVRRFFHLESMTLVGHSWGAVLALEYALKHPDRVARLILMNPGPASGADLAAFRAVYARKLGADLERQRAIVASPAYREGDPDTVAARYRLHFKPALARADDYERLMSRMKAAFVQQGREGILEARAVEDQLMRETWASAGYDLLPKLGSLEIPTLAVAGDHDFFPPEVASHIAAAIPGARLVTLEGCGHFAYLECPGALRKAVDAFFQR